MLDMSHQVTLEAKKIEIGVLIHKLDQLDNIIIFYEDVFEATEREITQLNQKLQEQDNKQWKMKMNLLYTVKSGLAKIKI